MSTRVGGSGVLWFVTSLLSAVWAALKFPFRPSPDIVHVHTSHRFSFYRSSFYVLFAAYVWRRPVVLHVHGSSFDEFLDSSGWLISAFQSLVFSATDSIIVLSEYWRNALQSHADPGKITVIPNAVNPGKYDPEFGPPIAHIVFISNLIERKGVREFATAIDRLRRRTDTAFRVSIAGRGPLASEVEPLAEQYDNVEYLGYISEAEKRALLDSASIFVLPTHAEGLPIAMLEGMSGGNAVVSTTVGSIPEVIGDENGILVDGHEVDQLTDALQDLLSSPETVEQMGRRNRRTVCEQYSWRSVTDRLLDVYEREF